MGASTTKHSPLLTVHTFWCIHINASEIDIKDRRTMTLIAKLENLSYELLQSDNILVQSDDF